MTNRFQVLITIILILNVLSLRNDVFSHSQGTSSVLKSEETDTAPRATIADVSWIAGHWQGEMFGGLAEEIWSPPVGGTMMGMYKLVRDGKVVFYELMIIAQDSNGLVLKLKHFNADLTAWEEKTETVDFPLIKHTSSEAIFDGLTFRMIDDETMQVLLRMEQKDGDTQEMEFTYRRVGDENEN